MTLVVFPCKDDLAKERTNSNCPRCRSFLVSFALKYGTVDLAAHICMQKLDREVSQQPIEQGFNERLAYLHP